MLEEDGGFLVFGAARVMSGSSQMLASWGVKGRREQGVLSSSSLDSKLCDGLLGRGNRCTLVVGC